MRPGAPVAKDKKFGVRSGVSSSTVPSSVTSTVSGEPAIAAIPSSGSAPSLKREDGFIDFAKMTFKEIENKMRAFDPWPGIYCFLNKKRLKVFSIKQSPEAISPGQTKINSNELLVGCLDTTIRLYEVQLEGKKRSSDIDLLNGLKNSQSIFEVNPKRKEV